jgi:predicted nucleic-acid-binding protein
VIAIDTNIVVRFLTGDDSEQFGQAVKLFGKQDLFIPDSVILETEWVLRFAYEFPPSAIVSAFKKMLGLPGVHVHDGGKLAQVLEWHEQGLDFADALHLANSSDLSELLTFDMKFARRAKDKCGCRVRSP